MEMQEGQEMQPTEGGGGENPAMMVAKGLEEMAATAPSPEVKAKIEEIMSQLGDLVAMMEGGGPPERMPGKGTSQVGGGQGQPVGPAGVV